MKRKMGKREEGEGYLVLLPYSADLLFSGVPKLPLPLRFFDDTLLHIQDELLRCIKKYRIKAKKKGRKRKQ